MEQFIDLGLPSGTKWASCNYGANSETEDGRHYSWDEAMKSPINLPTKVQFKELCDNTTSVWIENYKGSGVSGNLFVSKINGNTIFFPSSGYCSGSSLRYRGTSGCYWSSSLFSSDPNDAYSLYFNSGGAYPQNYGNHCYGFSVREVSE